MRPNALGDYLRGQRSRLNPEQMQLRCSGTRRVPGLRREEVALLAGVSVDYYARLEQGRERSPSPQVLDALSVALLLDDDGRAHLYRIAGLAPRPQQVAVSQRVDPGLLRIMDAWPDNPAVAYNRAYDILAANALATALYGELSATANLMLLVFDDPRARTFYADWPAVAANAVAGFRLGHGAAPEDPRIKAVLAGLLDSSQEFRQLWSGHQARGKSLATKRFNHPDVGPLILHMQTFDVRSTPGQELVVYDAEPQSTSAEALKLLGTIAATDSITVRGNTSRQNHF